MICVFVFMLFASVALKASEMQNDDGVKRVHDHVTAVQKKLNNEAASKLKRDAKKSYEFLSKLRRLSGALESDATAETEFDLGEREKKLVELATLLSPANGASIFESKGGIRASSVCPKGQGDILGDFEKSALGKTSIRGIKKHLQGSPWGCFPWPRPTRRRRSSTRF